MKFIQSATSEKNKLKKIINAFFLTNPHVNFSLKWDQEEKVFLQKVETQDFETRIKETLFAHKKVSFFQNENSYDGTHANIYLTKESTKGNAHKQNFIFINDRLVQDIQIHKVIQNSATKLWNEGESGSYIIKIQIPSDEIDVNIHPNKTMVKFFKPAKILSLISGTIKQIVQELDLQTQNHSHSHFQQESFSELNNETKDFNYRQVDFSSDDNTNNYLQNIHTEIESEKAPLLQILKKFEEFYLVDMNSKLLLLSLVKLFHYDLERIFSQCSESEATPLLVSRPIKLSDHFEQKKLDQLISIGFDCDIIDSNSLIVRSFPKAIQNYPYLKFIDCFIHDHSNSKNIFTQNFSWLVPEDIGQFYIAELVMKLPLTELLENNIVIPLEEKHFRAIYEKE